LFVNDSEIQVQAETTMKEQRYCSKCKKSFDKPKLIQYYACPYCLNKIEEEQKKDCQYWFGYLSNREKSEPIPQECVECKKAVECMLNRIYTSTATAEIKKWY
jgi:DNA-directed RNA polymerase subunit RPC12/RpoP